MTILMILSKLSSCSKLKHTQSRLPPSLTPRCPEVCDGGQQTFSNSTLTLENFDTDVFWKFFENNFFKLNPRTPPIIFRWLARDDTSLGGEHNWGGPGVHLSKILIFKNIKMMKNQNHQNFFKKLWFLNITLNKIPAHGMVLEKLKFLQLEVGKWWKIQKTVSVFSIFHHDIWGTIYSTPNATQILHQNWLKSQRHKNHLPRYLKILDGISAEFKKPWKIWGNQFLTITGEWKNKRFWAQPQNDQRQLTKNIFIIYYILLFWSFLKTVQKHWKNQCENDIVKSRSPDHLKIHNAILNSAMISSTILRNLGSTKKNMLIFVRCTARFKIRLKPKISPPDFPPSSPTKNRTGGAS